MKGGETFEQNRRARLEKSCVSCIVYNDYDCCHENCLDEAPDKRGVRSSTGSVSNKTRKGDIRG